MFRRILFVFLGLTLAGASLAWGQAGGELGGGGFQDRFLEAKRNQLGPALGVNQQTVDKLLAIDARYKQLRQQLVAGMENDVQRLQQLMSQPSPPEQEIMALLAEEAKTKGVDSTAASHAAVDAARQLSQGNGCVVCVSGETD